MRILTLPPEAWANECALARHSTVSEMCPHADALQCLTRLPTASLASGAHITHTALLSRDQPHFETTATVTSDRQPPVFCQHG